LADDNEIYTRRHLQSLEQLLHYKLIKNLFLLAEADSTQ